MQMQTLRFRAMALVLGVAVLAFSGSASADPPSRVARLGYTTGAVSFSPAGESDWVLATLNRPLTTGDRLWADSGARAEIQVGGAMIRMNAGTGVSVLNLDDRIAQLQLTQGTLNVRVRRLEPNQVFEVDTPNLAFTLRQPGEFRIEVDPEGNATTIVVRRGQGEVYGEGASYVIDSRQPYRFMGTGLREYEYVDAPRFDDFDGWSNDRDRLYDSSVSARYVSQDVVGYQDLDANGTWRVDPGYGNVWFPNRVAADWAPYRDGHWAWVDPWGWTWVDDAPWGFAVSHYGRWAYLGGSWGWVPGPVRTRAYYAPALVVFVGGLGFQLTLTGGNVGGVAWFPLGPREVYRPSYPVSRRYFTNINQSNTVINTTIINNYYTNSNVTNVVYANRQVPGAVVAVPTTAFVQSQPVGKAAVRVTRETVASAPVAMVAPVAPTERSVRGAAAQGDQPPPRVFERPIVARSAPAAAPVGFAAQRSRLAAQPGKPLDDATRKELRTAAATPAPAVKVVAPAQIAPPTTRPPAAPLGARQGDARGRSEERKAAATPAASSAAGAPPEGRGPAQAAPTVPAAPQPPESRGTADQRRPMEQRERPVAQPAPTQRAAPAPAPAPEIAPPQVAAPVPAPQPPESRGTVEQRRPMEQRERPVAPTQRATPAPAAAPQIAPPAPTAQPPEQRGRPEQRERSEQRERPASTPPVPAQRAVQPQGVPPQATPPVPAPQPPESRGTAEQRRPMEQRERPVAPPPAPTQRATPAPAAAPQIAPAPAAQPPEQRGRPVAPPQRAAEPRAVPPPQAAPPAPAAPQPAQRPRPEPAPAARQAEPRPPAAAPKAPPPAPVPAPKAEPRAQEPIPGAGRSKDKKKDSDELKREEEARKQRG